MRMACDLDLNSDLTNFFVQNIDDEIETEKKFNQSKEEWGKCLKEMRVFTMRQIENHRNKNGKSRSAIMKTTDSGMRFIEKRYLSADDIFAANKKEYFMLKENVKHQ